MLNARSREVKVIALGCRFRSWEGAESPTLSQLPVVHGSFVPGEGLWLLSLEETVSYTGTLTLSIQAWRVGPRVPVGREPQEP